MKGTILVCLHDLVTKKFGAEKWKEALKKAGQPEWKAYSVLEDVPDTQALAVIQGVAEAAGITMAQAMDAFGEHWSTQYAPNVYKGYFARAKSTRELLLNLDQIHSEVTRSMKAGRQPHFRYEWKGENHLVMHYESDRGLAALMPGLIRGLGLYFHDKQTVRVSGNEIHVLFA
jgi:hypothetical protein